MYACLRFLFMVLVVAVAMPGRASEPPYVRRVPIADPTLAATEQSRMNLKYLASCALDAGTLLVGEADGQSFEWPGGMGLAPDWHRRALTEVEERWVSACILARTNYFGAQVLLSLRSPFATDAPGLQVGSDELREFPVEEATFFGNLFRGPGTGYVCGGSDSAELKSQFAAHKRICALPLDRRLDSRQGTACDFVYVGACTAKNLTQDGVSFQQAVAVYLPAEPR